MKIKPSFSEFMQMAQQGNLIPVYQEFLADTETPVSAYLKLRDGSHSYLLESADGGKHWGRYSFIGCKPYLTVVSRDREMEIWQEDARQIRKEVGNPMDILRELSTQFRPVTVDDLPPFQGGLVGYCNYDLVRKWEHLPGIAPMDPDLPEAVFTACRRFIIFDHFTHMVKVVAFAHLERKDDLEQTYRRACREVTETVEQLHGPLPSSLKDEPLLLSDLRSNFLKEDFEDAVRKAKEYIIAGDVIQVVLSQSFSAEISGEDFSLTYNLVQMLEQMEQEVKVFRNDRIDIQDIEARNPSALMISPGPGIPDDAGVSIEAIHNLGPKIPILGVCLGHQAIAAAYGAKVVRANRIMHGKTSMVFHDGHRIYQDLPNPFEAVRYHSLIVQKDSLPDCLEISAWTEEGEIMGLRHRNHRVEGVQFHPESILTQSGTNLLHNFLT